jgi:hydroxymethylpyrimidine pyrophosphatase-like HAD family hydrolase
VLSNRLTGKVPLTGGDQGIGRAIAERLAQEGADVAIYLDVTHPQANEGGVVFAMSKLLNIPAEEIVTIGDMPNDVLMFEKSGVSIAMGNASPEVQAAATYVTSSNEEEGFAKAIEELVLNGRSAKV